MEGKQARGEGASGKGGYRLSQEPQERSESEEQARKAPRGHLLLGETDDTF